MLWSEKDSRHASRAVNLCMSTNQTQSDETSSSQECSSLCLCMEAHESSEGHAATFMQMVCLFAHGWSKLED